MKKLIGMALLVWAICAKAQEYPSPLEVVQEQLDAYNAQDLDRFLAVFHPQAAFYSQLGDTEPRAVGQSALREIYGKLFKDYPNNKSTLIGRMVQGNYVIDHEYLSGRATDTKIVAIYEVQEGLIIRCWFLR